MIDREKVIKGLECCMKWTGEPDTATCHCSDCSYTNMDILGEGCLIDLINDALALLKEQEAKEPFSEHHLFICPVCKNALFREQKYCHECGQAVKWG